MKQKTDLDDEQHHDDDEDIEPWHLWVRHATHIAEEHLSKLTLEDWVVQQRRRKFRWAHRNVTQANNRWSKFGKIVVRWLPQYNMKQRGVRRTGNAIERWSDKIEECLQSSTFRWNGKLAPDDARWSQLEADFIQWGHGPLHPPTP